MESSPVEAAATARPRRFLRRTLRALLWSAATVVVLLTALGLWLSRDPTPYFEARRAPITSVEEEWLRTEGPCFSRGVRIECESGLVVRLALKWPAATAPGAGQAADRLPVVVLLGGHRTGRNAVDLIDDTHGVVLASLDYPYDGDHRVKGLAVVGAVPSIRRALLDTPPALMVALDWLTELPFVDPARVDLVGVSLGAPFVVIAGALDPRFGRVWSIHGAGAPEVLVDEGLEKDLPFGPLRAAVVFLAMDASGVANLAPEHWVGRISPRPFLMLNATDDEKLPRACVEALWNAAGEPREQDWIEGGHIRPSKEELVREIVARVLERVQARPDEHEPGQ